MLGFDGGPTAALGVGDLNQDLAGAHDG